MSEQIEISFENVSRDSVANLTVSIFEWLRIFYDGNVRLEGHIIVGSDEIEKKIREFALTYDGAAVVQINVQVADLFGETLNNTLLRIVEYENRFDVEICFSLDDLSSAVDVAFWGALGVKISQLCDRFKIKDWRVGLESARDSDSLIISNAGAGPLYELKPAKA